MVADEGCRTCHVKPTNIACNSGATVGSILAMFTHNLTLQNEYIVRPNGRESSTLTYVADSW